ncbi:NAD-binding protein [Mucilaginibacter kameinonensis]|uniref:NAD-binding protein n=1 Tax=Mucilaginibacter kameinonensis TaxID=452286 RepID=UPI0013CF045D|nr:NAD-binding protein [Mucilaginibacter kameinonensis]
MEIKQRGYKLGRIKVCPAPSDPTSHQKNSINRIGRFIDNQTLQFQRGEKKVTVKSAVFIITAEKLSGNFIDHDSPCADPAGTDNRAGVKRTGSILIIGSGRLVAELATFYTNFNTRIWIAVPGGRLIPELNEKIDSELKAALKKMNIEVITELKIDNLSKNETPEMITFVDNERNYWNFLISLNSYTA